MPDHVIIDVFSGIVMLAIGLVIGWLLLCRYSKWPFFRRWSQVQKTEREFEIQLLRTQLELQQQTLQNISQEIHDNIGQALTFVKLNINTIDTGKAEETKSKLYESKQLITQVIHDLRNLSRSLNTDSISEAGLAASIEHQLHFLQKTGLYATQFNRSETWCKCLPDTEVVLFRVVQELLNNIVKHAEASEVEVTMDCRTDLIYIGVKDNGKGFIPPGNSKLKGMGLSNMERRVALLKGTFTIDSVPGKGTSVHISVPQMPQERNPAPLITTVDIPSAYRSVPA